jgi:predicted nuclease with TOPRIM domain
MDPNPTYEQLLAENQELRKQNQTLTVQAGMVNDEVKRLRLANQTLAEKGRRADGLNMKLQMELDAAVKMNKAATETLMAKPDSAMELDLLNQVQKLTAELAAVKSLWEADKNSIKQNAGKIKELQKKLAQSETELIHVQNICMDLTRGFFHESRYLHERIAALTTQVSALEAQAVSAFLVDGLDQLDAA